MEPSAPQKAYLRLYKCASRAVVIYEKSPNMQTAAEPGDAAMSYNITMTNSTLSLTPQLEEGTKFTSPDGYVLGSLAINGMVLAGTALVKSELEPETL